MTLSEKYEALLEDLLDERKRSESGSVWACRLDEKIKDLRLAIEEKEKKGGKS